MFAFGEHLYVIGRQASMGSYNGITGKIVTFWEVYDSNRIYVKHGSNRWWVYTDDVKRMGYETNKKASLLLDSSY